MNWNTYKARWTKGEFPGELRLRTDLGGLLLWLDGFPFTVPNDGSLKVAVPIGPLSVKIQDAVQVSNGVRKAFWKWNDGSQENPRKLQVEGTAVLAASYKQQYLVQVDGVPDSSNFTGWYDEGSRVELQVPTVVEYGNGTRNVFKGWSGDIQSDQTSVSIIADSPKRVEAKWQLQYLLTVEVHGLPDGTSIVVDLNGAPQTVTAGIAYNQWIDSGAILNVEPSERAIVLNGEEFTLESWTSQDSIPISMPISMMSPKTIRANYRSTEVYESNISVQTSSKTLPLGQTVEVSGQLSPSVSGVEVLLFVSQDNQTWLQIGQAITNVDGTFTFQWTPTMKGAYYVQARWDGNNERRGSQSPIQALNVIEYDEPISQPFASVRDKIQQLAKSTPGVNAAYVLVAGPAVAAFDIAEQVAPSLSSNPVLSQVIYFAIAGSFLGLIYLLPPALGVSVVRTIRRGYAPGSKGSLVVLLLWVLTLAAGFVFAFGVFTIASVAFTILALATMLASVLVWPFVLSYAVAHIIRP
jgi:hypothetical protein